MLPVINYDKRGRARDSRGRFLSTREARVINWVRSGQVRTENRAGRTVYRGPDGTLVPEELGRRQTETRYFVGTGSRYKELVPFSGPLEPGKFREKGSFLTHVHTQGASRTALDLGFNNEDQFVRWRRSIVYVPPEKAGRLADLFRLVTDRYIKTFLPFLNSPQMSVPLLESSAGNLWDFDAMELADDELAELLEDSDELQEAVNDFMELVAHVVDRFTIPKKQHAKGKKGSSKGEARKRPGRNKRTNKKK